MSQIKLKTQKIIKVGNSYAVTLDKEFLDQNSLHDGGILIAQYDASSAHVSFTTPDHLAAQNIHGRLSHEEKKAVLASKITPELEEWTENFLKENKEALEELANL